MPEEKAIKKGRKPYFFSFADWYLLLRLFFAESWRGNGIDYFVLTLFLSRSLYIHLHMREKSRLASLTHVRRRLSDHRTSLSFVPTGTVCGMPHLPKISVCVCAHECSPLSESLSPLVFLSLPLSFVGPPHHRSAHGPDLDCLPSLPFPPLRNGKCISATLSGRRRRRRRGRGGGATAERASAHNPFSFVLSNRTPPLPNGLLLLLLLLRRRRRRRRGRGLSPNPRWEEDEKCRLAYG